MVAKIISIINQKGGVGKTTSSINIASGMVKLHSLKVLLIDFDPQGNVSTALGIDKSEYSDSTVLDVIKDNSSIHECIIKLDSGLDLLISDQHLSCLDTYLSNEISRESVP